tara:strand:- start:2142 stop:2327 length:186 start_codon:yes stop_codon:yes gene_type:complete
MTTFKFAVPCSYTYEIDANSEDEARKILEEKGGMDIMGELEIEEYDYKFATLLNIERQNDA